MNNKIVIWSITVALAGFLFGFDTVVISGANQPIKELWHTTPLFHGMFIMSMALWGTVVGSLLGGIPCDLIGRKKTLFWIGVLYLVSAIGSAVATDPYSFSFFRFIGGLGVGASSVAAPAYISEISTSKTRGRLVALYQFNIVFGILIAFYSNYLLKGFGGSDDWRYMLGVEAIPALLYCLLILFVSESPRWVWIKLRDENRALKILNLIYQNSSKAIAHLNDIKNFSGLHEGIKEKLFIPRYKKLVWLAFFIAFFNQFSGINFILYYAPEILERAGFAGRDSLGSAVYIGWVNLIFTAVGMSLIDRSGRKVLMYIGSVGYIIGLAGVAYTFAYSGGASLSLIFILLFIASHAIGQGAVIWVFISEIFPNKLRAKGQSFGCSIHWIFAAFITLLTPLFMDRQEGLLGDPPELIFMFFAFMMVLQLLWVHFKMPETKGVSLEELQEKLLANE